MEFYLVKDAPVEFERQTTGLYLGTFHSSPPPDRIRRSKVFQSDLELKPVGAEVEEDAFRDAFQTSLTENSTYLKTFRRSNYPINTGLRLRCNFSSSLTKKGTLELLDDEVTPEDRGVLARILEVHGKEGTVTISLKVTEFHPVGEKGFNFEANGLPLKKVERTSGCEFKDVPFPATMWTQWDAGEPFFAWLTVTVAVNHDVICNLHQGTFPLSALIQGTEKRRLLEEATYSDLVLVAENGTEVKCHKVFLALHSNVFRAMFESKMKEASTNSVDMSDMTEPVVRAFLAYIYHFDITEASKSCEIALELLCAGHKYNISRLESVMRDLICVKPKEWFTAGMTIKLYSFVQKLTEDEVKGKLLMKAVKVLKWLQEEKMDELVSCNEYLELHKSPSAAMEFTTCLLKLFPQ